MGCCRRCASAGGTKRVEGGQRSRCRDWIGTKAPVRPSTTHQPVRLRTHPAFFAPSRRGAYHQPHKQKALCAIRRLCLYFHLSPLPVRLLTPSQQPPSPRTLTDATPYPPCYSSACWSSSWPRPSPLLKARCPGLGQGQELAPCARLGRPRESHRHRQEHGLHHHGWRGRALSSSVIGDWKTSAAKKAGSTVAIEGAWSSGATTSSAPASASPSAPRSGLR